MFPDAAASASRRHRSVTAAHLRIRASPGVPLGSGCSRPSPIAYDPSPSPGVGVALRRQASLVHRLRGRAPRGRDRRDHEALDRVGLDREAHDAHDTCRITVAHPRTAGGLALGRRVRFSCDAEPEARSIPNTARRACPPRSLRPADLLRRGAQATRRLDVRRRPGSVDAGSVEALAPVPCEGHVLPRGQVVGGAESAGDRVA